MTDDPKYPIGRFRFPAETDSTEHRDFINDISATPRLLRDAVAGLTDEQLDTPYREGGWTVRQVVHHLPDSHMNSYVRFRLALTEDVPTIGTYEEARWAELSDAKTAPIAFSLDLLETLHARWVMLLTSLSVADLQRAFIHPEHGRLRLDQLLALYAWHGRHHVAHITSLRHRKGW